MYVYVYVYVCVYMYMYEWVLQALKASCWSTHAAQTSWYSSLPSESLLHQQNQESSIFPPAIQRLGGDVFTVGGLGASTEQGAGGASIEMEASRTFYPLYGSTGKEIGDWRLEIVDCRL